MLLQDLFAVPPDPDFGPRDVYLKILSPATDTVPVPSQDVQAALQPPAQAYQVQAPVIRGRDQPHIGVVSLALMVLALVAVALLVRRVSSHKTSYSTKSAISDPLVSD